MLDSLHKAIVRLFLRRYRKQRVNPTVRAVLLGDGVSTHVILDGVFEPHELKVLETQVFPALDRSAACLDIGANIGNHASVFSRHFDRVFAFEPNPLTRTVLTANAMGRAITVVPLGLSDKKGTLPFHQDFQNMGASRVAEGADGGDGGMTIQVDRLDDIAADLGLDRVAFIKIDVEGHEAAVLRGASALIARTRPVLALEAFFRTDPSLGQQVMGLLSDYGYRHFYALAPSAPIARRLQQAGVSLTGTLPRLLLPARTRKARTLSPIADPLSQDHQLLVASMGPLPGVARD